MHPPPTLIVISQVYVPDPAAVGQYMHDAAAELVQRGFRVVVLTSRAGYDDPTRKYARFEVRDGVEIRRLPGCHFGKASILLRLLGAFFFLAQSVLRTLCMRRVDGVLVSTSPPMCAAAAIAVSSLRRAAVVYWAMDINPDQAVALGRFPANSFLVRCLDRLNRAILRRADRVVALDRFMAERLRRKHDCGQRLVVIPPWPLDEDFEPISHRDNPFRREHALDGKFVVMYSGNMSIAHPLDTILQAARQLKHRSDILFLFVGGGLGRRDIERSAADGRCGNVIVLPYQPREALRYSLSAADVHLVAMGDDMVGIVHPSKIYGAMACARPILLLGPGRSHAGELLRRYGIGWRIDHGDVSSAVRQLGEMADAAPAALRRMGLRARRAVRRNLSRATLRGALCDEIETCVAQAAFFGAATGRREPRIRSTATSEKSPARQDDEGIVDLTRKP